MHCPMIECTINFNCKKGKSMPPTRASLFFLVFLTTLLACKSPQKSTLQSSTPNGFTNLNMEDKEDQVKVVIALLKRHPNITSSVTEYRGSMFDALDRVPQIMEVLGEQGAPIGLPTVENLYSTIYQGANLVENTEAIESLKNQLLETAEMGLFSNLEIALKEIGGDKQKLKDFFRILPFAYRYDGSREHSNISALKTELEHLKRVNIMNGFQDVLPNHLAKVLYSIQSFPESEYEDFFKSGGEFNKALQRISVLKDPDSGQVIKRKALSIEPIPALGSIFRSCFGIDCSLTSVPYFGLEKKTKVFLIRESTSHEDAPIGYLLSTLVSVDGIEYEIPYIITINGPKLGKKKSLIAIDLYRQAFGFKDFIVPLSFTEKFPNQDPPKGAEGYPPGIVETVINTDPIRKTIEVLEGSQVDVKFGKGFKMMDEIAPNYISTQQKNYYDIKALGRGKLVTSFPEQKLNISIDLIPDPYAGIVEFTDKNLLERANLVADYVFSAGREAKNFHLDDSIVLNPLQVSREQAQLAMDMRRYPLHKEFYQQLQTTFGYTPQEILKNNASEAATLVCQLLDFYEKPKELESLARTVEKRLLRKIETTSDDSSKKQLLRKLHILQFYIQSISNPNASFESELFPHMRTLIRFAQAYSLIKLIKVLAAENEKIYATTIARGTLLGMSLTRPSVSMLKLLKELGTDFDYWFDEEGTAHHITAIHGSGLEVAFLTQEGVPIDLENEQGVTPSEIAAEYGNVSVLRHYLEVIRETKILDGIGPKLFGRASNGRRTRIGELLLEFGYQTTQDICENLNLIWSTEFSKCLPRPN